MLGQLIVNSNLEVPLDIISSLDLFAVIYLHYDSEGLPLHYMIFVLDEPVELIYRKGKVCLKNVRVYLMDVSYFLQWINTVYDFSEVVWTSLPSVVELNLDTTVFVEIINDPLERLTAEGSSINPLLVFHDCILQYRPTQGDGTLCYRTVIHSQGLYLL